MNGLEAIELMKQGKIMVTEHEEVQYVCKIANENVYAKKLEDPQHSYSTVIPFNFFSYKYEEYTPIKITWGERKYNRSFFYIDGKGIQCDYDIEANGEGILHSSANYFSNKEKAYEISFKQTLFRKLQRFSDENGGIEIDLKDKTSRKYTIGFNHYCNSPTVQEICVEQTFGTVHFVSYEIAEQAIKLFYDDLITYFTM